jgi:tRNA1(Val) A37 N6-methylase TrmN6
MAEAGSGLLSAFLELSDEPMPEDATCDLLARGWRLYQRKRGHRTSSDDQLAAWMAVRAAAGAPVPRYLDIGCGIGSVLLLTAATLRPARSLGVEAQRQSARMAHQSVVELPDAPPIRLVHGDLRELTAEQVGNFELITGSPPYFPVGTGVPSPDPQREACRFELRGGVEGYCDAAGRLLTPEGRLCLVFQTVWTPRVHAAAQAAGLRLVEQVDVRTRRDRMEPFLSGYTFARGSWEAPLAPLELAVRDASGAVTGEWNALRAELGLV